MALAFVASMVSGRAAERESVADARHMADFAALAVVQPSLDDGIVSGQPAAVAKLNRIVHNRLLNGGVVRVKVWTATGRIVYSDEPRLIGRQFPLRDDEAESLRDGKTAAEVSDLALRENAFERGHGKLLEVYRPVQTPSGERLLFETYSRYDSATSRRSEILWSFGSIMLVALLLLALLQLPLVGSLLRRVRHGQQERERLLTCAIDASDRERRRIAADLHDGIVQELAGASYVIAAAADKAASADRPEMSRPLQGAAASMRDALRGLRSLLVDIYPPNLRSAGLGAALGDLVPPLRTRGVEVELDLPESLTEAPQRDSLIYRVAQESLRNIARHAEAHHVRLAVRLEPGVTVLLVQDDGCGFDPTLLGQRRSDGHVGLRGLADLVAEAGAVLKVASAPGRGTALRLEVPAASS